MATANESGNMLEEFKDEFSCCICLDLYNLEEKIPRLLKCSHSFCTKCLIDCLENDLEGKFRCPLCDVPLKIRSQDVANLQVNIYLTNIMEKIMNRSAPVRNAVSEMDQNIQKTDSKLEQDQQMKRGRQCQTHNMDAANFCVTCDTLMCPKCVTTMTASSHVDHEIALVEEVFDDKMQNLIRCKALLAEAKTFMESKDSEAVMSLKTNVYSLKLDIKSTANDLRTQIDQWETKSSNELNKILEQAERKNKSEKMADLNKMLQEINEAIVKEKADVSTRCTLETTTNLIKATETIANVVKSYRPCTLTPYFSKKAELKMGKLLIKNANKDGNLDTICDQVKETAVQLKQEKTKTKTGCYICQRKPTSPVSCPQCKHPFCKTCLDASLASKPVCPTCGHLFRALTGTQPKNGNMAWEVNGRSLAGHEGQGTIVITYTFPPGVQGPEHPNPGVHYPGIQRTAYLPASPEGHQVLRLLIRAFEARLTFTIGRSVITGLDNQIVWNGIQHKTNMTGGQRGFGYPDPTYLGRVRKELAARGIK